MEENQTTFTFEKIIELTSQELFELIAAVSTDSPDMHYAKCIYAYLVSNTSQLSNLIEGFQYFSCPKARTLKEIATLRLKVRKNEIDEKCINRLIQFLGQTSALDGEIHFVTAQAFERLENEEKVFEHYQLSFQNLRQAGVMRKAVAAALNLVACKDRIDPKANHLPEYFNIVSMAKDAMAYSALGTALLNIAREFSLVKSYQAALKYADEAVEVLREHMYGSYQYNFALCNRCDIHCKLGNFKDALTDFEEASQSAIPEIQGSLSVLSAKINTGKKKALRSNSRVVSTWRDRLESKSFKFTKMEVKLIETLKTGSLRFEELTDRLYNESASDEIKSNRVRQIIFRIRKKMPGCIQQQDGIVSLARNMGDS